MFNIRSRKCSPASEVYWKKPLFTLLENYFFPSLELPYAALLDTTMKNINEEDAKTGTRMKENGVAVRNTLQIERQGLKADVTKVSTTRKTWMEEHYLSCKSQTTRKKRGYHLKLSSSTFSGRTQQTYKTHRQIRYSIQRGERGRKQY